MRKFGWYAVSASVAAFIVGCVLLLAANLYVQSQVVQQRIRRSLATALRMPVSIKKTTITPWEGLRIDGLTAHPESVDPPAKEHDQSADYLLASSFRVRFALWPLFAKRECIINEVLLDQPKVTWAQDEEGRWQLPAARGGPRKKPGSRAKSKALLAAPPPESPGEPPSSAGSNVAVAPSTPPAPPDPVAATTPPGSQRDAFVRSVDKIRLRHGNLAFLNNKRHQVGHFEEVDLDGHLPDAEHATGAVSFAKASLPRVGLTLTKFHSDFAYGHDEGLALNNSHAQLAGGTVTANYQLRTAELESPYSIRCRLENVSLAQLIREAGSRAKLLDGRLQGELEVSGLSDHPESRSASGQIQLLNARVRDFPIFRVLGEILRIDDLSHMEFKQAQLDYRLEGTELRVEPLVLVSNDLRITAQGKYLTDTDRLDLHARLTVDEAVTRRFSASLLQQFLIDPETPGSRFIDFDVTGPAAKPNTNLYKRVLIPQVNDLLQNLLSPKARTPKDKFLKHVAPALPTEPSGDDDDD